MSYLWHLWLLFDNQDVHEQKTLDKLHWLDNFTESTNFNWLLRACRLEIDRCFSRNILNRRSIFLDTLEFRFFELTEIYVKEFTIAVRQEFWLCADSSPQQTKRLGGARSIDWSSAVNKVTSHVPASPTLSKNHPPRLVFSNSMLVRNRRILRIRGNHIYIAYPPANLKNGYTTWSRRSHKIFYVLYSTHSKNYIRQLIETRWSFLTRSSSL